jgi:FkbM family methyltransferase
MIHKNPFISAFIGIPEWPIKNKLRHWLAESPLVPEFIQDFSPIKGYEKFRKLQSGDRVVDAGAFPGDYTLFAAKKVGPEGHVYALEPDDKNREILERNLRKARIENVTVIPYGLWNCEDTLYLNQQGLASQIQEGADLSIKVQTLDQLVCDYKIEKMDVLKMDIEGAELQALEGAASTLSRFRPYTCVASYHIVDGSPTSKRVETLLQQAGLFTHSDYPKHRTSYGCSERLF